MHILLQVEERSYTKHLTPRVTVWTMCNSGLTCCTNFHGTYYSTHITSARDRSFHLTQTPATKALNLNKIWH